MRKSRWVEGDEFDLYKFKLLSFRFYLGWIRRSIFRANLFTKDHDWSQLKVPRIAHRIKPLVTFAKKKPMELNTNFHVFSKIFFFFCVQLSVNLLERIMIGKLENRWKIFFFIHGLGLDENTLETINWKIFQDVSCKSFSL